MTPVEELGYKVGDKFVVLEGSNTFEVGSIVTLYRDDESSNPLFKGEGTLFPCADGEPGAYIALEYVKPYVESAPAASPGAEEWQGPLAELIKQIVRQVVKEELAKTEKPSAVKLEQKDWQAGDTVRCIKPCWIAELTVGRLYTLTACGPRRSLTVVDDVGDRMRSCVSEGCFEFVSR